ncbi:MAG: PhzF family phenazine biosynthesis protein [Clostridia bacterium]|nr:PhzF family phenazine biosynthesis protein [Clostridia bacterium]MDE6471961.1 PhzF family phenazine biosynthesis protein [Clostridia bacterium]
MKQYIVDVFADKNFRGNQAAVCVLDKWLSEELMQNIAKENNFSETSFAVKKGHDYELRWFTPGGEIDFCGHATLGTAYVINRFYDTNRDTIKFMTAHGELLLKIKDGIVNMTATAYPLNKIAITSDMIKAIGVTPKLAYKARDLMFVLNSQYEVENLNIDIQQLKKLDAVCVAVTAKGEEYDCVSRVFAPQLDVIEDSVTGSTHCMIAPYWAKVLNKKQLIAYQASERSGIIYANVEGKIVNIAGKVVMYSIADILSDCKLF